MPRYLMVNGKRRKVATEDELLDFANRIREAGGANALEALLPSRPGNEKQCLIANALNFGCSVDLHDQKWAMYLPETMTKAEVKKIADSVGCTFGGIESDMWSDLFWINLPTAIGNAAEAFDAGVAFQDYVNDSN